MLFSSERHDDSTIVELPASFLRRDIAFGTLLSDQKLKINALRTRYGGSNHSMRETLRILSAEGLIEATAQQGLLDTVLARDEEGALRLLQEDVDAELRH